MAELAFVKSFLSVVDSRAIKIPADHVFDPERVGLRVPYTLPRLQPPRPEMPKKVKQRQAPGASKSITIRLKSARNPALEFTVPNTPLASTSVEDLKDAVRARVADSEGNKVALEKIKILYKRKPVTGKSIAEVLADEPDMMAGGKEVEFGVMVMGGAKVVEPTKEGEDQEWEKVPSQPAAEGERVLENDDFWDDLQTYLGRRLQDGGQAKKLRELFRNAWISSR
ncbi:hypothetical protein PHISP_01919 [Aspergillus sp. HF37]|nr:hypothetical protein PHISP_01919 [Aspergillus sp. HF37]